MASFIIASIAYSKLGEVWTENGRKGVLYWSPEHGVWYAVKPRGDVGIHSIEVCWHRRRLG